MIPLIAAIALDWTIHIDTVAIGTVVILAALRFHSDWVTLNVRFNLVWEHYRNEIDQQADVKALANAKAYRAKAGRF